MVSRPSLPGTFYLLPLTCLTYEIATMDINQALLYYGSDKAKEDFLMQQEAEKNKRKL